MQSNTICWRLNFLTIYFFSYSYENVACHQNFICVTASYSSQVDARSKHYLIETDDNNDDDIAYVMDYELMDFELKK